MMGAGKRKGICHPLNPSSPPPPAAVQDSESVLNLLPVTILALALPLPTQDREVLAYLLARSVLNLTSIQHHLISKCKKRTSSSGNGGPLFGCACFECYTSFWYRWDSSPNRELIHDVIEGFEEHLLACEETKKNTNPNPYPNKGKRAVPRSLEKEEVEVEVEMEEEGGGDVAADVVGGGAGGRSNRKCLARKVLPDVVGLFNSRLWNLWSPGI